MKRKIKEEEEKVKNQMQIKIVKCIKIEPKPKKMEHGPEVLKYSIRKST